MLKYNFYQIRIIFYRLQSTNWRKIRNNISNVWTIYQLSYTYATWFCVECSLSLFSSFHIFHYLVIIFWRKNVFIILLKKERKWICFFYLFCVHKWKGDITFKGRFAFIVLFEIRHMKRWVYDKLKLKHLWINSNLTLSYIRIYPTPHLDNFHFFLVSPTLDKFFLCFGSYN